MKAMYARGVRLLDYLCVADIPLGLVEMASAEAEEQNYLRVVDKTRCTAACALHGAKNDADRVVSTDILWQKRCTDRTGNLGPVSMRRRGALTTCDRTKTIQQE